MPRKWLPGPDDSAAESNRVRCPNCGRTLAMLDPDGPVVYVGRNPRKLGPRIRVRIVMAEIECLVCGTVCTVTNHTAPVVTERGAMV